MTAHRPAQASASASTSARPKFFENSWHGTDVDTAARVESAGAPAQILLSRQAARFQAVGDMPGITTSAPSAPSPSRASATSPLFDADYDQSRHPHPFCTVSLETIAERRARMAKVRLPHRPTSLLAGAPGHPGRAAISGTAISLPGKPRSPSSPRKGFPSSSPTSPTRPATPVFDSMHHPGHHHPAPAVPHPQPRLSQLPSPPVHEVPRQARRRPRHPRPRPPDRPARRHQGLPLPASVDKLGNSYVITLNAQNTTHWRYDIATEQAQAPDKDHVLEAVSARSATAMRSRISANPSKLYRKSSTPRSPRPPLTSLEAFQRLCPRGSRNTRGASTFPQAEGSLSPGHRARSQLRHGLGTAWRRGRKRRPSQRVH